LGEESAITRVAVVTNAEEGVAGCALLGVDVGQVGIECARGKDGEAKGVVVGETAVGDLGELFFECRVYKLV